VSKKTRKCNFAQDKALNQ